jgi:hypothetical protein
MDLVGMCLNSTYFLLGDRFYEQASGLAVGSPLSPILADHYMERMKKRIREEDTEGVIKFWKHYVDDVFAIISKRGNPTMILELANSISATVKLTLERERRMGVYLSWM